MGTKKYTKTEIDKRGRTHTVLREGIKKVNIGNDVWTIGRKTIVDNIAHCVIYGPDNKQYHVWGTDAYLLYGSYCNRQGNTAIERLVKIYILTSILDDRDNWVFNLKNIPPVGKLKINNDFGYDLNVCFLNYYLDQTKALGWHADDSEPIDQSNPIAVVSLGEKRELWIKPFDYKGVIPTEWRYPLNDGSLFIMPPGFQSTHKHKIPKGDRVMGSRISLTYRRWRADY